MKVSILIPSYNNPQFLNPCVDSIARTGVLDRGFAEVIIVNNGKQPCEREFKGLIEKGFLKVVNCPENKGWEGGLEAGLKVSNAEFVCFQNDDTHIPSAAQPMFYENLCEHFKDEQVGIVAPSTTVATGLQSIFHIQTPRNPIEVKWLIFCCVIVRRTHLEEVGGVDTTLPGGDDFDLSIRMRKAGKKLMLVPECFIIHHAFKTGVRVKGNFDRPHGWNSLDMQERTNQALIRKHGFSTFIDMICAQDAKDVYSGI